jgi:hypothetical protein
MERRPLVTSIPLFGLVLVAISLTTREGVIWSPYHYITIAEANHMNEPPRTTRAEAPAPGPALRSMKNPPMYAVRVNQHSHQLHGTIDADRHT